MERIEPVRIAKSFLDGEKNISGKDYENAGQLKKISAASTYNYGPSYTQAALSDIPAVHDLGLDGTGVIIGILDTGFRWKSHPALSGRIVLNERDFVQGDMITENQPGDAFSQDSHGTAVFSIMAGLQSGSLIGPAFNANFILAKTENVSSETHAEEDNYAAALEWMEAQGVQITSSSLGYNEFDAPQTSYTFADMNGNTSIVAKALNHAFDLGVSTFTAAGNERGNNWNHIISPADAFKVIAVGSVTSANLISSFSSPGPTSDGRIKPEIAAMGSSDYHALTGGGYGTGSGTSYATPIAAGIAGLLKSAWPHLNNQQIRNIFLESGDNSSSPNNDRGYGLISAKKAVSFPNMSLSNNIFKINKIFIDLNTVNTSSVQINYKIGSGSFQTASMAYDGYIKFNFQLPSAANGTSIEFYFTYQNNIGAVRDPAGSNNYKLVYGNLNINNLTAVDNIDELPSKFNLSQNYPNPFNPETIVNFDVPYTSRVSLKIYDLLGREVASLFDEVKQPGSYKASISALKLGLSSGVYFYSLKSDRYAVTKKMVLIK